MRFPFLLLAAWASIPRSSAQLNELAKAAGKLYFGTATDNPELSNSTYISILDDTREFGQLTPSNGMKVPRGLPSIAASYISDPGDKCNTRLIHVLYSGNL